MAKDGSSWSPGEDQHRGPDQETDGPPRVLWVIPTIGSSFGGPTSTAVNGLIAENRAGLRSEVATTIGQGEDPESIDSVNRLRSEGVITHLFPRTGLIERGEAWGLSPRLAFWLIRNARRYDVIHLQYVWCLTSIVGAVVARLAGVPLVITPHESLTNFDIDVASRHRLLRFGKLLLRRLFLRTADRLVFMSEIELNDTRFGSTPVEIVSHAVMEKPAEPRAVSDDDKGALRIAFFGRNIRKKGIHLIVQAMARNKDRDWKVTIAGPVGEPDYVASVKEEADRAGLEEKISWLGYVDSRSAVLESSDVLAMPSVYEGFGMVAAEAMCSGVPVIVPRASGVAELVSEYDAGLVMAQSDVDELESALKALDDSPELRRRAGENGLRAANERLTFDNFAARTGALYRSLSA